MQIELRDVDKQFGSDGRATVAVSRANLSIERGSFVSLCGPSGCGKSTLLSMVLGIQLPTRGEIRIEGNRVVGPSQKIGTVFQDASLMPWRTVIANILYPIELRGLPKKKSRERAFELLALTGLTKFADHYPSELSGGMRQRVAICRALVGDPDILLMDEPFSALDALTRDEISVELQNIWSKHNKTVLFVTHSIREAVFLSDRVVVMGLSPGRIVEEFAIDLDRPRSLDIETHPKFSALIHEIRESISRGRTPANLAAAG
ncbi:MAG: ABC transporter ATP-binding protein [Afipia sp.]|nr:ABC transporter ATP-binding protein [Afipia sp.]